MTQWLWELSRVQVMGAAGNRPRLQCDHLQLTPGVTAVIGPSGAGKSTLLNLLVGFERPTHGHVRSQIRHSSRPGVYWSPDNFGLWPHLSALDHIELVLPKGPGRRAEALNWLEEFDLAERCESLPAELSQGERSRLSVARALAAAGEAVVLDEPLAHVDPSRLWRYWQVMMDEARARNLSLIFATHQVDMVFAHAPQAVCLHAGEVIHHGPVRDLYHLPASEQLALMLGPANWVTPAESKLWLSEAAHAPCALRPEHTELIAANNALTQQPAAHEAEVLQSRWAGGHLRTELRHKAAGVTRHWLHREGEPINPGMSVIVQRLRPLMLLLMLLLSAAMQGCVEDSSTGPALKAGAIEHWQLPADGARIPPPRSVDVGPNDEVYVLDTAGRILIYSPEGVLQQTWHMPTNLDGNPESVCVLKDGRIAVADTHYHRIVFFDRQGKVESMWGRDSETQEQGTFKYPVSVVQDEQGDLYISEYGGGDRIQKFTVEGKFLHSFGSPGTGDAQFQRAAGSVLRNGKLYVADATNGRIQVFTAEGKFLMHIGGEVAELKFPYDVAVGPAGDVYAMEWGAGRISLFTAEGKLLGRFGSPGTGMGQFRTPWGIAVDSRGRVRVADTQNRRIVAISSLRP